MKIATIGCGQAGLSASLGAYIGKFCHQVIFYDTNPIHIEQLDQILKDFKNSPEINKNIHGTSNLEKFQKELIDYDMVILATPINTFGNIVEVLSPYFKKNAILTDLGSLKIKASNDIKQILIKANRSDIYYWWSHPGVGNEKQGPHAAQADMYHKASVFIAPSNPKAFLEEIQKYSQFFSFWEAQGSQVQPLPASIHDLFFGITSHLEHVLVFSLMALGARDRELISSYQKAGTILRNITRVATANPNMWLPIFEQNKEVIIKAADGFKSHLEGLLNYIKDNNSMGMIEILQSAYDFRVNLSIKDKTNTPEIFRETLLGEIYDLIFTNGNLIKVDNILELIQKNQKWSEFNQAVLLPYLMGVAITLNAKNLLENEIDLPKMGNPSFLDGSSPALFEPEIMTKLLMEMNKDEIIKLVYQYIDKLDEVIEKIKNGDKNYLINLINLSKELRSRMPLSRRFKNTNSSNEAVRVEYLIKI